MNCISFAWTTAAFLADKKLRTRRNWSNNYAQRFIKAYENKEPIGALDKLFRIGGKQIGTLMLTSKPFREPTSLMNEFDYQREGLLWMEQQGMKIKGLTPREFFENWKLQSEIVWVITFKRTE